MQDKMREGGREMRILVVDDEQLVRWFLERALKKWGHDVTLASNIKDASKIIVDGDFDILFTDLRMPEGSGSSLIQNVNEMKNDELKIVVCSAFITPEMASDFYKQGIVTLKKPFKLSELECALRLCMEQ